MALRRLFTLIHLLPAILVSGCGANGQPTNAVSVRGLVEGGSEIFSLGASTTGTISTVLVKAGDHVQAGQILLQAECRDLESERSARQADFGASEAIFARVTHGSRPEEIAIGEANVNLATARLIEAQKAFDRTQALREGVTITRAQLDQAERDARMASAMLEEVRAKLVLLKVGSRDEEMIFINDSDSRMSAHCGRSSDEKPRECFGVGLSETSNTSPISIGRAPSLFKQIFQRDSGVRGFHPASTSQPLHELAFAMVRNIRQELNQKSKIGRAHV